MFLNAGHLCFIIENTSSYSLFNMISGYFFHENLEITIIMTRGVNE